MLHVKAFLKVPLFYYKVIGLGLWDNLFSRKYVNFQEVFFSVNLCNLILYTSSQIYATYKNPHNLINGAPVPSAFLYNAIFYGKLITILTRRTSLYIINCWWEWMQFSQKVQKISLSLDLNSTKSNWEVWSGFFLLCVSLRLTYSVWPLSPSHFLITIVLENSLIISRHCLGSIILRANSCFLIIWFTPTNCTPFMYVVWESLLRICSCAILSFCYACSSTTYAKNLQHWKKNFVTTWKIPWTFITRFYGKLHIWLIRCFGAAGYNY